MTYPTTPLDVEVDLNLGGTWVNATSTGGGVLHRDAISVSSGRGNWAGEVDPARLGFTLRNNDGRWSPDLVTSANFGLYHRNIPTRMGVGLGDSYLTPTGFGADLASTPDTAVLDITGDMDVRADFQLSSDLVDITRGGERVRLAHKSGGADGWEWELYNALGVPVSNFQWYDNSGVLHSVTTEATGAALPLTFNHDRSALRVTLDADSVAGSAGVEFWNVYDVDNSVDSPTRTTTALGYSGAFPILRSQLDGILDTWVAAHGGTTRNVANTTDWTNAMAAAVPGDLIRITATISTNLVARGNKYGIPGSNMTASPSGGTTALPIIITCADGVYIDPNNQSNNVPGLDIVNTSHVWAIGVNIKRSQFGLRCMNLEGDSTSVARICWNDIRDIGHSGLIFQGIGTLIAGLGGTPPAGSENTMGYSAYILAEANTIDNMGLIGSQFGESIYLGDGSNEWMSRAHHVWIRFNTLTKCRSDYTDIKPGCHHVYVFGNTMTQGSFHFGAGIQILYGPLTARPSWYDFDPQIYILFNRIHDGNITTFNASSSNYVAQASLTGVRFAFNLCWGFASGGIGFRLRGEGAMSNARSTANEKWWVFNNLFWTSEGVSNGGAPAVSPVPYPADYIDARNNLGFTTTTGVQFTATSSDFANPATIPAVGVVGTAEWLTYGLGSAFDMAGGSGLVGDGTGIGDIDVYINDLDISQRPVPASALNPGAFQAAPAGGHTVTFWTSDSISGIWTQLGSPVTTTGTTTVKANAASLRVAGNPGDGSHIPLPGRFNAFELRDGFGGTVVANPIFTSQAPGTTVFTDGAGRVWTMGAGGRVTNMRWRFHGELASLPVRWNITGSDVYAPVEATGLFRRLRQGDRVLESALRRATVRSAIDLVQYWPCEEVGSGLTQFGAAVGTAPLLVYLGGSPKTSANSDFPSSSPIPQVGTTAWAAWVDSYPVTSEWQVRWLMSIPTGITTADTPVFRVETTSGLIFEVHYQDSGGGNLKVDVIKNGALAYTSGFFAFQTTGRPMRMHLEVTTSGANISYQLLGQPVGAPGGLGVSGVNITSGAPGAVRLIIVNQDGAMGDTAIGHITLQSSVTPTTELADGLEGYEGETAGSRIQRLCLEEGIAYRMQGDPADSEPMGVQTPATLMELLQECADADGGVLYEARDSVAVAYRTRVSMQAQTPLVLNYAVGQLAGTPELDRDDQGFANDVTVTTGSGSIGRAVLDDGSFLSVSEPPSGAGRYNVRYEANCLAPRASDMAGWRLRLSAVDEPRVSKLELQTNLPAVAASSTLTQGILDLNLGDLVKVDNLPANVMTGSIRQIVQGTRESITMFSHRIDMVTTPASPWDVRKVEVDARYDTAGSILASAALLGATSLSVSTLTGPIWTTTAGDFPFDINVGGVRVTVTNITGASSVQTFTISALPRAMDVGFPVQLADPTYYEL